MKESTYVLSEFMHNFNISDQEVISLEKQGVYRLFRANDEHGIECDHIAVRVDGGKYKDDSVLLKDDLSAMSQSDYNKIAPKIMSGEIKLES